MSELTIDDICRELATSFPDLLNIHLDIDDSFLSEYGSAALERAFVEWAKTLWDPVSFHVTSSYLGGWGRGDEAVEATILLEFFDNTNAFSQVEKTAKAPTREEALARAVWEVVKGEREA